VAVSRAGAKFISGGANLLDLMKLETEQPTHLVDISRLPEIRFHRRIGTYGRSFRLPFRKRTRRRYENDADDQNSRHRDHQSRF
jgi:xanthine dehydrogenase YagS FAD-binding subunit